MVLHIKINVLKIKKLEQENKDFKNISDMLNVVIVKTYLDKWEAL